MAYPAKTERNNELMQKLDKGWSYRKIAKHFNISLGRVQQIKEQEEKRAANNSDV